MDEHLNEDERFDASQYAFFGGAISQEVELGGLDEEEDINLSGGTYDEDEKNLNLFNDKDEVETLNADRQLDGPYDTTDIIGSLRNLGLVTSSEPQIDEHSASHVPTYLSQRESEERGGFSNLHLPASRPHPQGTLQAGMFQDDQQPVTASHGNLFAGYRLPPVPLPARRAFPPYPYRQAGHTLFPPPPPPPWHLMPSNFPHGISQGFVAGFSQHPVTQQYSGLPVVPEAFLQRRFGRPRGPLIHAQRGLLNPILSAHPIAGNDFLYENDNTRDLWYEADQREQHLGRSHELGRHGSSNLTRNATQHKFRSKYMTIEEIEGIAKIQRAATQNTDPYIGDYYHQAVQAKTINGKHQFAPHQLRDLSSQRRSLVLQPSFVPVDGLGKVPFSSVRSPRPLLEVEGFTSQTGGNSFKGAERPLEQEPMLAARIAIEDGLCRLLDVDDIDRFLSVSPPPDGGAQLRQQRQNVLEELALSLQLLKPVNARRDSGPASSENDVHLLEANSKNIVFYHIASLPKGRKLLSRFVELLPEGSELVQRVCTAIFCYLHYLFDVQQKDLDATAVTLTLAKRVADCAIQMDLMTCSACLGAVVSSPDLPAFRPFSSSSGEGVSLIMKSVLDRATSLLTDTTIAVSLDDRKFWQATFDSFFNVLFTYCTQTFDRILHTTAMSATSEQSLNVSEAAAERMGKELPIEILYATLPHMTEQQRKALLEFTQRSIVKGPSNGQKDDGHGQSCEAQ